MFLRQPNFSVQHPLNIFSSQMFPQRAQFFHAVHAKHLYLSDFSSESPFLPCSSQFTFLTLRCFLRPSSSLQNPLNNFTSQMFPHNACFFCAAAAKHFYLIDVPQAASSSLQNPLNNVTSQNFPQTAQFFHAAPAKYLYLRCFLRQPSSSVQNPLNNSTSQIFPQTAQFFHAEPTKYLYLRCFLRQPSSSEQHPLNIFTSQMFLRQPSFFRAAPTKHFYLSDVSSDPVLPCSTHYT